MEIRCPAVGDLWESANRAGTSLRISTAAKWSAPRQSKLGFHILAIENSHDLGYVVDDEIVDGVNGANTAWISRSDFFKSRVAVAVIGDVLKAVEQRLEVSIRLSLSELKDAPPIDALQIEPGVATEPVAHHRAALASVFQRGFLCESWR